MFCVAVGASPACASLLVLLLEATASVVAAFVAPLVEATASVVVAFVASLVGTVVLHVPMICSCSTAVLPTLASTVLTEVMVATGSSCCSLSPPPGRAGVSWGGIVSIRRTSPRMPLPLASWSGSPPPCTPSSKSYEDQCRGI